MLVVVRVLGMVHIRQVCPSLGSKSRSISSRYDPIDRKSILSPTLWRCFPGFRTSANFFQLFLRVGRSGFSMLFLTEDQPYSSFRFQLGMHQPTFWLILMITSHRHLLGCNQRFLSSSPILVFVVSGDDITSKSGRRRFVLSLLFAIMKLVGYVRSRLLT